MPLVRRLLEFLVAAIFLLLAGIVFLEEKRAHVFRRRRPAAGPGTFAPMRPAPKPAARK